MPMISALEATLLRDLGDGLILRRSTPADAETLAAFNASIHSDSGPNDPDPRVGAWVRDLLARPHPTFHPEDFTLVEDSHTGQIVSSLNLISQTWSYGGIPFKVGRPELVGTHPDYRNRGLVRAQFEVIHQWSAERGERVQAITGIPYYYRLFGYEMAVHLGGGRVGYLPNLPKLEPGTEEPYWCYPASQADLEFIAGLYQRGCQRSLLSCLWDKDLWLYELSGKSPENVNRYELCVIKSRSGEKVGFIAHPWENWGDMMAAVACELLPGVSYAQVAPSLIRYLLQTGEQYADKKGKGEKVTSFGFWLGKQHPLYQVLHSRLPRESKPYAWYLRVADLPGFLRHIRPVLEQRLAQSALSGHSGELKLTFYRSGLHFVLEKGHLTQVEAWLPTPVGHSGDAAFPALTFLQLLFGYRSLEEIEQAFPDCWYEHDDAYALLNALFPKQDSDIWAIS